MDWPKVKTILIVLLLAFNLFLAGILFQRVGQDNVSKNFTQDAIKILSQGGVQVNCPIPDYMKDMGTFTVSGFAYDTKALGTIPDTEKTVNKMTDGILDLSIKSVVGKPEAMANIGEAEKAVHATLQKISFGNKDLILDRKSQENGSFSFTFCERVQYFILYDNVVHARISKNNLIVQAQMKTFTNTSQVTHSIIPAYQILLQNYNTGEKTIIQKMDIGIKTLQMKQEGKGTYQGPSTVWRVMQNNGRERFFIASTGAELKEGT